MYLMIPHRVRTRYLYRTVVVFCDTKLASTMRLSVFKEAHAQHDPSGSAIARRVWGVHWPTTAVTITG